MKRDCAIFTYQHEIQARSGLDSPANITSYNIFKIYINYESLSAEKVYSEGQGERVKELLWIGNALKELRDLPEDIKREVGFDLRLLQKGGEPRDFKPMSTVGKGVLEIRVRDGEGRNVGRCFYVVNRGDKVIVLHSFVKKSQKTPKAEIEKGQVRYKSMEQVLK